MRNGKRKKRNNKVEEDGSGPSRTGCFSTILFEQCNILEVWTVHYRADILLVTVITMIVELHETDSGPDDCCIIIINRPGLHIHVASILCQFS